MPLRRFARTALPVLLSLTLAAPAAAQTPIADLLARTHVHGIAVDRAEPRELFVATHHGLYRLDADGTVRPVSDSRDDFMGFVPHPSDSSTLFASGHPAGGGNLGLIVSEDGGRTWRMRSAGLGGPVDFHQMTVSPADPDVIYGVYRTLQRSDDGGNTWREVGPPPDGVIDLAAGAESSDTLYAATQRGLLRSRDGGRSWGPAHAVTRPATMIEAAPDGTLHAFVAGLGLIRAREPALDWRVVNAEAFGRDYVLHFAASGGRLYAVTFDPDTRKQALLVSDDDGTSWRTPGRE